MAERQITPEEMREKIEKGPAPLEGPPIHDRGAIGGDAYELAALALARAVLLTAEENPDLLDVELENERDPLGGEAAMNEKLWEATQEKYPGLNSWLGGISGFQWGWAHNAVRHILAVPLTGNPGIVVVGTNDCDPPSERGKVAELEEAENG